jgi:hypothetical protein
VLDRAPDDLPPLLHETFLTSLTDPYVIAHSAAVELLDHHRLPHRYDEQLEYHVLLLVEAHSRASGNHNLLKTALDVYLDFKRGQAEQMPDQLCDWVIERIRRCKWYEAGDLLKWHGSKLWHRPKFLELLLAFLNDPETSEHQTADLLETLEKVPQAFLRASATEILETFKSLQDNGYYAVDTGIELLTCNGLWNDALTLAKHKESKLGDSEWERARKMSSRERVLGCSIEVFAQNGDLEKMRSAIEDLRALQDERQEDEKKHAEKRDPLFGIARKN